jgi:glycosyltransferase involved in cell wall biosynthesis
VNKKVLHFIDSEGLYGAESVILNLSSQMLKKGEFKPIIGCIVKHRDSNNDLYDAAIKLGIEAIKLPISNSLFILQLFSVTRMLKKRGVGLIHAHGYKPSVYGFLMSKLSNIQVMATCHLWFQPESGPLKMRLMIALEKKFYKYFTKIVTVSEPIKQVLVNNNINADRVSVVPNGVDVLDSTSLSSTGIRTELHIKNSTMLILNSGRLVKQKAQWVLIEAAKLLEAEQFDFHFIIVGEGDKRDELDKLITKYHLNERVSLLGFRSDIPNLLLASDCFALPSIDEGMPMSLLEAAAIKTPVICTLVGDISKLIEDNESGLVIPINDPKKLAEGIIYLFENKEKSKIMAENAKLKLINKYSSEEMAKNYGLIYSQLLVSPKR